MLFDPIRKLYLDEHLLQLDWLEHGFGTRQAGGWVAGQDHASLDQIHSDIIVKAAGARGRLGAGDGLITSVAGLMVGVRTADCVPILLADQRHRAVAAVHAGWRGTLARIAARAVEAMTREYGSQPEDLIAAIGPCIGRCCYEVGPDVARAFGALFPELPPPREHPHLDLEEANRRVLAAAGVPAARIHAGGLCTACRAGDFHSYRRDGLGAGRLLAAIGLKG